MPRYEVRVRKARRMTQGWDVIPTPAPINDGPATAECPVSLISQRSVELIQVASAIVSGETINADIVELPGSVVDALRIIQRETKMAENAIDEAVHNE
jgi:hypothetical protein